MANYQASRPIVRIRKPGAIICGVQGVTTSKAFWKEILAPRIRMNAKNCIEDLWDNIETQDVLTLVYDRMYADYLLKNDDLDERFTNDIIRERPFRKTPYSVRNVCKHLYHMLNTKNYSPDVQSLIVLIWFYSYRRDNILTHVYKDVVPMFKLWYDSRIKIVTFGEEKLLTQEMMFALSIRGNISHYLTRYFGTHLVGSKTDPKSYKKIAKELNVNARKILILSDVPDELRAAKRAGCTPILVVRRHNEDCIEDDVYQEFVFIKSFQDIELVRQ